MRRGLIRTEKETKEATFGTSNVEVLYEGAWIMLNRKR